MTMTSILNKAYKGCRTLSETFEKLAEVETEKVFASIPRTHNVTEGLRDVTVREVLQASDAFACWLATNWGQANVLKRLPTWVCQISVMPSSSLVL